MKNIIKSLLTLTLFLFVSIFTSTRVDAASYSFNPSSRDVTSGDQFSVTLSVDPAGKQVSSIQATLGFQSNLLEVKSISFTGLFPSNDQFSDNSNGIIKIGSNETAGGTYIQNSGEWVTITFLSKGSGSATLGFTCPTGSGIYELGTINNLLSCSNLPQGSFNINSSSSSTIPTPTPTPVSASCNTSAPAAPAALTATTGSKSGEVNLKWVIPAGASNYNVIFGNSSGSFQYGATNIGNINTYTIKSLNPGQIYYFKVSAVNGCASSGFSNEASARAKGIVSTIPAGTKIKVTPTPVIYQPIGEVLPEAIQPTVTPEAEITVTPLATVTPQPENQGTPYYVWVLAGVALLIIIVIVALLLTGRSGGDDLPPVNMDNYQQPMSPPGSGTGTNQDPNVINQPQQ